MADIKTHLRELSVAVTVGMLIRGINPENDMPFSGRDFFDLAKKIVSNDITPATNILEYGAFSHELNLIINNGIKLGNKIYHSNEFHFAANDTILWYGYDTQKENPVDIQIGRYGFSLKEDSYILKNMGLYELLNCLTGANYKKGLHVFLAFAEEEFDEWFAYSWNKLIQYLESNGEWIYNRIGKSARIAIDEQYVMLYYNTDTSIIPRKINCNSDYMRYTKGVTREEVFAKWISQNLKNDPGYLFLKKKCSDVAGQEVCNLINQNYTPSNMFRFFRILPDSYYYAKTTAAETTILKVPSQAEFAQSIVFNRSTFEAPVSQLNILSSFTNTRTGHTMVFRNECRYSHGQFNGTPEAKMYATRNTSMADLYNPVL